MAHNRTFPILFIQFFALGMGGSLLGPLIPVLAKDYDIGFEVIGSILSLTAFTVLLASLTSGILSERFGKKNVLLLGNIIFITSFSSLALSKYFYHFAVSYIMFGLAWGIIVVTCISIISDTYPSSTGKVILRMETAGLSGMVFAPLLVSTALYLRMQWRYLFFFVVFLNLVFLIFFLSYRKKMVGNRGQLEDLRHIFITNRSLLSDFYMILLGIVSFLTVGLGFAFSSWFTTYFEGLNVPVAQGSLILSLYLFFYGLGVYLKSFFISRFEEKKMLLFSSVLAVIFLFLVFIFDDVLLKVILIMLFSFSFSGINSLSTSFCVIQRPRYSGSIVSIMTGSGWLGVVVFQYLTGFMTDNVSETSVIYISLAALFVSTVLVIVVYFYRSGKKIT